MNNRIWLIAAVAAIGLPGCAGISPEECAATDWRTVGYEHGVRGARADAISEYRKGCAEHGVTTDLAEYRAGREQGLREFCTARNGFNFGARGGRYGGVCPSDLEPDFLAAYDEGHELYLLETEHRALGKALSARRAELKGVEKALAQSGTALLKDETTDEQRVQLVVDLKQLAESRQRLTTEIEQLERDLRRSERRLNRYRNGLAYRV